MIEVYGNYWSGGPLGADNDSLRPVREEVP
jgi:hypothetical protein